MAGYAEKSLLDKLGYEAGDSVYVTQPPEWFSENLREHHVLMTDRTPCTWAHCFIQTQTGLTKLFKDHRMADIEKGLWISWPKKASGITTDITENTVRDFILLLGWVDVKVVAIDETWSALKFVRRKN
jgi:hypothetical protein